MSPNPKPGEELTLNPDLGRQSAIPFRNFAVEATDTGLTVYPLSRKEMEAVNRVIESGGERVVRTPTGFTVVAKDDLGVKFSRYALQVVLRIPSVEYVLGKYGEILSLVASMQPVKMQDLDMALTMKNPELSRRPWQHRFLAECRILGIISVENEDAPVPDRVVILTDFGKKLVEEADVTCR